MKKTLALAALLFTTSLTPVEAAPIGAIIGAIAGAIGVSTATVALVAINLTASVVMSAVQRARMKKAGQQNPGIRTERKLTGGVNSRSIILGRYATAGAEVCPPYSRGRGSKTPNAYLTYIISLCDVAATSINRIIINGEYVPITAEIDVDYGNVIGGKYLANVVSNRNCAFVKFYDGTQTTADAKLVELFGADPDRPWTNNHVGRGVAYAITTFKFDNELFKGEPEVRYELNGAKLYDPRKDDTRGGSGTQRAATPSTWAFTQNPVVMAYNVLKGIPLGDGRVYGARVPLDDLPLTEWVAAMNVCDETITTPDGPEPRYRAGLEIRVAEDEPADIIDDLMLSCMGEIVEIGGVWKVRAGGPGLPVMFVEDGDFLVSKPSDFDPFPPSNASRNTVNVTYPHPEELWQPHDAPSMTKQEYLDRDGEPIVNEITLNTVPFPRQAQRLASAWLKDDQRWRSHLSTFGPYALHLEPLDVIQWTSDRNFYSNKRFEITATEEDLLNLLVDVGMRETDPSDYDPPSVYLPDAIVTGGWRLPGAQSVPGFAVTAYSILDKDGVSRRAAIRCVWDVEGAEDARALNISVRRLNTTQEIDKSITHVKRGTVDISEGILAGTQYEVRAIYDVDRPVIHTSWLQVTTGAVVGEKGDITETVKQEIYDDMGDIAKKAGVTPVSTLPTTGTADQIVMLIPPGRLYRWDASLNGGTGGWTDKLYGGIPDGYLTPTMFAQSIEPNTIIPAGQPLPTVKSTNSIVWNGALYTWNGTQYTTPSFSLTPGIVKETHIDALAVSLGKIADSAVTAIKLANGAVTRDKILDGAISELKIAAGAVTDAKIAGLAASKITGQLTDAQVADLAAAKLTGTITSVQIATGAVTDAKIAGLAASKITGQLTDTQIAAVGAAKIAGQIASAQIADSAITDAKIAGLAASKITGQLTDTQIAAVGAAKIAGQIASAQIADSAITDAKIAAIAAGKVTGQLTNAQIAAVAAAKVTGQITGTQITDSAVTTVKIAANAVTAAEIAAGTITAAEIASNAITAVKINAGAVETAKIAALAIDAGKIAAGAIVADKIAADAVTAVKIIAGAIDATKIAADAIVAASIASNAVTSAKINAGAVVTAKIAAGAIDATKIAADAVIAEKIAADAVTAVKIIAGAIDATKIAAGAVVAGSIASNAVTAVKINAGAVETAKIAADAIDATKIAADAIVAEAISASAITAGALATNAVTAIKISASAVETAKIAASAVVADKIAANAITAVKISAGAVEAAAIAAGAIEAGSIATGAIVADKIAASAVTSAKIATDAVIARTIQAGAVGADSIAAKAIVASKLAIMDMTNLIPDSEFQDPSSWLLSNGGKIQVVASDTWGTGVAGAIFSEVFGGAAGYVNIANSGRFPVEANIEYYVDFSMRRFNAGTGRGRAAVFFYDQAGIAVPNSSLGFTAVVTTLTTPTTVLNSFTAPADAAFALMTVQQDQSGTSGIIVRKMSVRRKNGGNLIVDGAISTLKLAADSVTANAIAANAVEAGAIKASAITADKIAANAITAAKIAAGAIGTDQLAAKAIVASKIAIADFTNLVPDDQIQDASSWVASATPSAMLHFATSPRADMRSVGSLMYDASLNTARTDRRFYTSGFFPVTVGDELFCSGQAIRQNGTRHHVIFQVIFYDKNDVGITNPFRNFAEHDGTGNTSADFKGTLIVPAGAMQARFAYYIYGALAETDGDVYFGSPTVRIKNTGELIIDGAITTNKIKAGAITAESAILAALAVTSGVIGNLAVGSGKIADLAVGTAKIANSAITNAKIDDLAVTNAKIGNASVNALKIGANALYIPYLFTRADVEVTTARSAANRILLFDRTIPDFEGGGYTVEFNGYYDSTASYDAYGALQMIVDGVEVARTRFGVRSDTGDSKGMFPISIGGNATGYGTTNIKVNVWNSHWDSISGISRPFWLRDMTLTVSGSRR